VARLEVLGFFDDARKSAYREFTVSRAEALTGSWFLSTPESEPTNPEPEPTNPEPEPTNPEPEPISPALHLAPEPTPPSRPASRPALASRRPRVSRIGVAAVASVAVTAVFALVGFHTTPSASTASGPPTVAAEGPGSVAAQRGGADAALPVKVKRSSGAPSSTGPLRQSAASKTESLAVAAASQPGTPPLPSQTGSPATPAATSASASASSSAPGANGTLAVTPDRLDLGRATTGQLTLTAMNGPVSWSADTSSSLVTLNSQQGTLQAGQSVTLTVSVTPGRGDEFVFIYSSPLTNGATKAPSTAPSASQAVEVTWTAGQQRGPRPSPSPSPSDSSSPSPSPSPSPSVSAAPSSVVGGS
jgi:hypothetical protein